MNDVPTDGAWDLGGPEWELALVRRIQEKSLAWNSEKTCRSWCRRFMTSVSDKQLSDTQHSTRAWGSKVRMNLSQAVHVLLDLMHDPILMFHELFLQ
jgi:hypothetical protein